MFDESDVSDVLEELAKRVEEADTETDPAKQLDALGKVAKATALILGNVIPPESNPEIYAAWAKVYDDLLVLSRQVHSAAAELEK